MYNRASTKAIVLTAVMVPFMTACATRGFVREHVSTERMSIDSAMASSIGAERQAREAADGELRGGINELRNTTNALRTDVEALRRDITSLRNDFNVEITQLKEGLKFSMPVNFGFDDAAVRPEDRAVLDRFASVANNYYGGSRITVEGFADPAGPAEYNQRLSKKRADNVRDYLVSKGLANEALSSVGYGESRLVVQGAAKNQPGAELNRRVVFVIESRPGAITMMEDLAMIPPTN